VKNESKNARKRRVEELTLYKEKRAVKKKYSRVGRQTMHDDRLNKLVLYNRNNFCGLKDFASQERRLRELELQQYMQNRLARLHPNRLIDL